MSEIESKRKELEDDIGEITVECGQRTFEQYGLDMFNLGVEMARKEFIEWLDDFRDKNENMIIEEVIHAKIMELKQSLEEKK